MLVVAMPGGMKAAIAQAMTMASAAQAAATSASGSAASASSSAANMATAMQGMPSAASWTALTERVAALEARTVRAFGVAPIPALALGGSDTVQVEIGPAQINTTYCPQVKLISLSSVLATLTTLNVSVASTTRVDVTVRCSGVLAGGAAFVSVRV